MTKLAEKTQEFRPAFSADVFFLHRLINLEVVRVAERGDDPSAALSGVADKLGKSVWSIIEAPEHVPGAPLAENKGVTTFVGQEIDLLKSILWNRMYRIPDGTWEQQAAMNIYCSMPHSTASVQ